MCPSANGQTSAAEQDSRLTLRETEWAYIAGILDGEGSISYYQRKNRPSGFWTIEIANTNLDLIHLLEWRLGYGFVCERTHHDTRHKRAWYFFIRQKVGMVHFLQGVMPYLVVKKENAWKALEWAGKVA